MIRLGAAPGLRHLRRKLPAPGEVRESPDPDDRTPLWCADCWREILFDLPHCPDCGGRSVTGDELARIKRQGPSAGSGPTSW
jgi:hypothetical protein